VPNRELELCAQILPQGNLAVELRLVHICILFIRTSYLTTRRFSSTEKGTGEKKPYLQLIAVHVAVSL